MTREAEIRQTADEWLGYYHPTCTQDMLVEAFRCGAEWADAHQPSPWISVEDRLPEESEKHKGWLSDTVFVVTNQGDGTSARYDLATKTWCPAKILRGHITHWMPIPGLSKGGEK